MDKSLCRVGLDEVFDITDQLITVLASDDNEFKSLKDCGTIEQLLNELYEDQENKIKDEIIALTSECDEKKQTVEQLDNGEHAEEISEVSKELQRDKQHKTKVERQFDDLKKELEVCNKEKEELEEENERLLNNTTKVIPAHRHDINLYNYISGIRWQYDCPKDEIKGYVANKKHVKPFSLNTKQNSQFFIVNYLWDLVENEWE